MSFRTEAVRNTSDFVQLLREFLSAHAALTDLFAQYPAESIPFEAVRVLVGDDERAVLYRLKQRSHALFRSETYRSQAVRREALFDLIVGSLFHETMKLRESLYQREVYAPRVAALRDSASDEPDALFEEFDRILGKSSARLNEVVSEVRILLSQTREQFRRLLIERAGDADVTRFLLARRSEVDETFPDGFEALLVAMHGDFSTGLIEAARSLLGSAYFLEAGKTLREAAREAGATKSEIRQLQLYAEGMQAFLDGDYRTSVASVEGWVDLGAALQEPELARRAALALSRIGRLVENDDEGSALVDAAKQLQLRLETPES